MKMVIKTSTLAVVSILLIFTALGADEEIDKSLNPEQQALQADIEHSLVAPCCWNMTVDQHDSPVSRQVRQQVAQLIEEGRTKKEILAFFSSQPQYGERILASPSQDNLLGKLAYWLIPLALVFGIFVVVKTIRSSAIKKSGKPANKKGPAPTKSTSSGEKTSPWDKRVENELKQFD